MSNDDERALPKPEKNSAKIANPSVPGIQQPNRPDGRDAPPPGETR